MFEAKVEKITPKLAEKYLEKNTNNRNINRNRVLQYAKDMQEGMWLFSGDPIKFSKSGEMIDGQHRLLAIIEAEKAFDFLVLRGLEEKVKETTDIGKPRNVSDIMGFLGHKNTAVAASVLRLCCLHQDGMLATGVRGINVSPQEQVRFMEANPDIEADITFAVGTEISRTLVPSVVGFMRFITRNIDQEKSDQFFHFLVNPPYKKNHPCTCLMETVNKMRLGLRRGGSLPRPLILALTIKAWNAFCLGKDIVIAKYQKNEDFPLIHGYDED